MQQQGTLPVSSARGRGGQEVCVKTWRVHKRGHQTQTERPQRTALAAGGEACALALVSLPRRPATTHEQRALSRRPLPFQLA